MRSLKKPACLGTLLLLLGALHACSSSAPPASSSAPGPTQTVTGIAVPRSVAVVTANNAN